MIIKVLTEMDSLSHISRNELGEFSEVGNNIRIDYGKQNDYAIVSAYVYLHYGKDFLNAGDKEGIKRIRVIDETGSRFKLFIRGNLNPWVSMEFREAVTKKVDEDLIAYFKRIGHKNFAPLMVYSVDNNCGGNRNDFAQVLRECGFIVPNHLFKTQDAVTLRCTRNDSEICILPNDQLMAITDDKGTLSAYLANCYLTKSNVLRLRQYPPEANPSREYADVQFCWIDQLRDAWNEYVRTL